MSIGVCEGCTRHIDTDNEFEEQGMCEACCDDQQLSASNPTRPDEKGRTGCP